MRGGGGGGNNSNGSALVSPVVAPKRPRAGDAAAADEDVGGADAQQPLPFTKAHLTAGNHPDREDPARLTLTKRALFSDALRAASLLPPPPPLPRSLLLDHPQPSADHRQPELLATATAGARTAGVSADIAGLLSGATHYARNRMLARQCRDLIGRVRGAQAPYWGHLGGRPVGEGEGDEDPEDGSDFE